MKAVPSMDDWADGLDGHHVGSLKTMYHINICSFCVRSGPVVFIGTPVSSNDGGRSSLAFLSLQADGQWSRLPWRVPVRG